MKPTFVRIFDESAGRQLYIMSRVNEGRREELVAESPKAVLELAKRAGWL